MSSLGGFQGCELGVRDDAKLLRRWDGLFSLELKTTVENTDTHHGEEVVRRVGMIIDTSEESSGRILADVLGQQVLATGVLLHERRDIMDKARDENQVALLCEGLEFAPIDDRQVVGALRPLEGLGTRLDLLKLHGHLALLDLVIGEHLEMAGETEPGHGGDEPLGRVVLIPFDGVTVVHRELMVEVVVSLADGNKRSDEMVTGSVLVIERSLSEPVSERVDTEGRVVDETKTSCAGVEVTTAPIAPAETGNDGGDAERDAED